MSDRATTIMILLIFAFGPVTGVLMARSCAMDPIENPVEGAGP